MASREELLQSIRPDMKLSKAFFMRIYGYEITWPGFAEVALQRLEEIGCSKAREYYSGFVAEYEPGRRRNEGGGEVVCGTDAEERREKGE